MTQFVGLLSPGLLLRSLFSGVFFLIAFCSAVKGPDALEHLPTVGELGGALPVGLFAGVVIYALHRSVVYALIEWPLNSGALRDLRKRVPLISEATITALLRQWKLAANSDAADVDRGKHFSTWADYAHLQYTAALCIGAGSLCGRLVAKSPVPAYFPLIALAVVFGIAALVADWRLHAVREYVEDSSQT